MDVLTSGSERRSPDVVALLRRRPPRWAPAVVGVALLATLTGAVAAVPAVREASERPALEVAATSVVAVRTRGRDGVLVLQVRNTGPEEVRLHEARIEVGGVVSGPVVAGADLVPGAGGLVEVAFAVPSCAGLAASGRLVLGRERFTVGDGGAVPVGVLGGCEGARDDVVALEVHGVGGDVERTAEGARGTALVEVVNVGTQVFLVGVRAEAPGVVFSPAAVGPLQPGGRTVVRLPFEVPSCAALRRTGRVVLTLYDDPVGRRELGFRATEDEEARTLRDVDLDVALRACE